MGWGTGFGAVRAVLPGILSHRHPSSRGQAKPSSPSCSRPPGQQHRFPIGTFRAWPGCSRGWGLGEPRTILLLAELLAGGRAKAPFHFLPLLLRLWYRGVVSDTSWEGALWEDRKRISLTEIISIVYFLS